MSGNPTGSNVVPMPHAQAPATAAPQMPMPMPGMWGGGSTLPWGPGCCPPGGMDALMKCYCDVQAATAFICSVMVTCIQTNPAVTAAIIAAIEASGSSLPLIGVTNGSAAQPGQVGEWVTMLQTGVAVPTTSQTVSVSMGVLPPGDWDCFGFANVSVWVSNLQILLNPVPAGFTNAMEAIIATPNTLEAVNVVAPTAQALISVPTLIVVQLITNNVGAGSAAGTASIEFSFRRAR